MPNRIIKESICTSEEINQLSDKEEVFFYRLMVNCDDYGLMDARPAILKARCYPLKSIDIKCIQEMLGVLQASKLVFLYQVDGRPYLQLSKWEKHQQIRAKRAKHPLPKLDAEITCNQLIADVHVIQSNPIQSTTLAPEDSANHPTPQQRHRIGFDGAQFIGINGELEVWKSAYPAIDVEAEIRKAAAWLVANPANKKKQFGRFINGWLSRAQEKAPRVATSAQKDWI